MQAPTAKNLPEAIDQWCYIIPEEEKGVYPIDQSDGGEDDDPIEHAAWADYLESIGRNPRAPWIRQVEVEMATPPAMPSPMMANRCGIYSNNTMSNM